VNELVGIARTGPPVTVPFVALRWVWDRECWLDNLLSLRWAAGPTPGDRVRRRGGAPREARLVLPSSLHKRQDRAEPRCFT
jgi:hypothetical protein